MLQIANKPGTRAQGEGIRVVVEADYIYIDTSQLAVQAMEPKRVGGNSEPKSLAKRVHESTNETTEFMNDLLWGPRR